MIETIENLRWLKRRVGKGGMATYLVQIVNKPHQIIAFKARYTLLILLPIKYFAELIVKPGRRPVEAMELLQGQGTG
jgi:hypothetical protein